MRLNRLGLLLGALVLVAGVRFLFPPPSIDVAPAEIALPLSPENRVRQSIVLNDPSPDLTPRADDHEEESDLPGNAFAARPVPTPIMPPTPLPAAVQLATVKPVPPPAPPEVPPPLQVVGTYNDGAPAVFVDTAQGMLLARAGTVLLSQYKVTAITPQQLTVLQLSTQKTTTLPIAGRSQ